MMLRHQGSAGHRELESDPSGEICYENSIRSNGMELESPHDPQMQKGNYSTFKGELSQVLERLDHLEGRAEATRRAEESARAATKEAREATRRADEASEKAAHLIASLSMLAETVSTQNAALVEEVSKLSVVRESRGKAGQPSTDDIYDELEGLKRAQKRIQDDILSKATQISSMSMAQEDNFRTLNMCVETCKASRAESERAAQEIRAIQSELKQSSASITSMTQGRISGANGNPISSQDSSAIDGLRRDVSSLQQHIQSVASNSAQQVQQIQKHVNSIVEFAEKINIRQESASKELADIKHQVASGSQFNGRRDRMQPVPLNGGMDSLKRDIDELAMAMGEVAGRFSSMEQDVTVAFASCARAVDVKEVENHMISRHNALEDKIMLLGRQIAHTKDQNASSPASNRHSDSFADSERGSYGSGREGTAANRPPAWGTPQSQQPGMPMQGMPFVQVPIVPMGGPGMVQFTGRAPSSHLAIAMKQGMAQQAQASAGRFTRISTDGVRETDSLASESRLSTGSSSRENVRAQHPSNRVLKTYPKAEGEGGSRAGGSFSRAATYDRANIHSDPSGQTRNPSSSTGAMMLAGNGVGPSLSSNPPAAPFLSRLQQPSTSNSNDGSRTYVSPQHSSPTSSQLPQSGSGPLPFEGQSMVHQMSQMMFQSS